MKVKDVKQNGIYKLNVDQFLSYGYARGQRVRVTYKNGSSIQISDLDNTLQLLNVNATQLDDAVSTKEELEAEIKEHEAKIKEAKDKLAWMKATKNSVFDEDEFKVWQVLQTLDDKTSNADKAKVIAALIRK